MTEHSRISWCDSTFNAWIGCSKVSQGCARCYAERLVVRRFGEAVWGPKAPRRRTSATNWRKPKRWNQEAIATGRRHLVFSGSLCDMFEDHPDANRIRPDLWDLIRSTKALTWQLLTKRPENIARMLPADWGERGWPHVWLGTSIEDMRVAERSAVLAAIPARVRFISYEPAIGPVDELPLKGIHWLIAGGESGPGFRPAELDWFRRIRDRCAAADTAFFFKQGSALRPGTDDMLDGVRYHGWPVEMPHHG